MVLAGMLQAVQFGLLGLLIFGERAVAAIAPGLIEQEWYRNVMTNRFGVGMGIWFVGNMLYSGLVSTGAFEVFFNGQQVCAAGLAGA